MVKIPYQGGLSYAPFTEYGKVVRIPIFRIFQVLLESHRAHLDPGQAQKMLEYGGDAHGCPTLPGLSNTRGL